MKLPDLLHSLLDKFVPMEETQKMELQTKAKDAYTKLVLESEHFETNYDLAKKFNEQNAAQIEKGVMEPKIVPPLKLQHKAAKFLDQWWMRYVFAIMFIFLVPRIKAIINGDTSTAEEEPDDDDSLTQFMEFQRYKKSLR